MNRDQWEKLHAGREIHVDIDGASQTSMSFTDLNLFELAEMQITNKEKGGEKVMDQGMTNFCHSFATTVGLRNALKILFRGRVSMEVKYGPENVDKQQMKPVVVKGRVRNCLFTLFELTNQKLDCVILYSKSYCD